MNNSFKACQCRSSDDEVPQIGVLDYRFCNDDLRILISKSVNPNSM